MSDPLQYMLQRDDNGEFYSTLDLCDKYDNRGSGCLDKDSLIKDVKCDPKKLASVPFSGFYEFRFYPFDFATRVKDAFWDMLGGDAYRPSSKLFISIFCAKQTQPTGEEIQSLSKLEQTIKEIKLGNTSTENLVSNFLYSVMDRWDVGYFAPLTAESFDADEEPLYWLRFRKIENEIILTGVYTDWCTSLNGNTLDRETRNLLLEPLREYAGSQTGIKFSKGIYLKDSVEDYLDEGETEKIHLIKSGMGYVEALELLLTDFKKETQSMSEGEFDSEPEIKRPTLLVQLNPELQ